jgi:hypothetical protein
MTLALPHVSLRWWALTTVSVVVLVTHARCATVSPVVLPIEFVGRGGCDIGQRRATISDASPAAGGGFGSGGATAGGDVCVLDRERSFTFGRPVWHAPAKMEGGSLVPSALTVLRFTALHQWLPRQAPPLLGWRFAALTEQQLGRATPSLPQTLGGFLRDCGILQPSCLRSVGDHVYSRTRGRSWSRRIALLQEKGTSSTSRLRKCSLRHAWSLGHVSASA